MNQTEENSTRIRLLNKKLEELELKRVSNPIPIAVNKPNPPYLPSHLKNRKPNFLQIRLIIINMTLWFLPVLYLLFVFYQIHWPDVIGITLIFAFLTRLYVHTKELKDYRFNENIYKQSLKKYEVKLQSYNQAQARYYKYVAEYQSKKRQNDLLDDEKTRILLELQEIYKLFQTKKNVSTSIISTEPLIGRVNRGRLYNAKNEPMDPKLNQKIAKVLAFISKLTEKRRKQILYLLNEVSKIQKSKISSREKRNKIKYLLWTSQSGQSKLFIGAFLGTIAGLFIFGTGGIGIAGLGGAFGIWGFLAGTTGGVVISSLIQNFEKNVNK